MILKVEHLSKSFTLHQKEETKIVGCRDVSFTLEAGEFVGITGKSGAGKSTILKCIYRTYIPTGGAIQFSSERFGITNLATASEQRILAIRSEEISYVSQFLKVLPRVTALDMVAEGLLENGYTQRDALDEAKEMLIHFHLPRVLWDAYPHTFSGGEKLRLNLARAMVKRPKLLLLDEPTASLDEKSKESVQEMIIDLKKKGTSMLGIFHDLAFMEKVIDSHYVMEQGTLHKGGKISI